MHVISFCTGIGGLELGLKLATANAARTVLVVEREGYCASVLRARMQDGSLDDCPIWSDVKFFDPSPWRGKVDCITAGYPCQPFSTAGRRKGAEDPRHLWPYISSHIRVLHPRYVFCENVPGHLSMGFEQVCEDLCGMGYSVEAGIFSAAEVGAPHLRKRLFFLAHATGDDAPRIRRLQKRGMRQVYDARRNGENGNVADTKHRERRSKCTAGKSMGRQDYGVQSGGPQNCSGPSSGCAEVVDPDNWAAQRGLGEPVAGHASLVDHLAQGWPSDWEDGVRRVATGQSFRIDRLRALGNAVVPQTAALAWTTLLRQAMQNDA